MFLQVSIFSLFKNNGIIYLFLAVLGFLARAFSVGGEVGVGWALLICPPSFSLQGLSDVEHGALGHLGWALEASRR